MKATDAQNSGVQILSGTFLSDGCVLYQIEMFFFSNSCVNHFREFYSEPMSDRLPLKQA